MNTNTPNKELPVALEFAEVLRETLTETLKSALEKLNAPDEIKVLLDSLDAVAYYFYLSCGGPENFFNPDGLEHFDSDSMVIEAINNIAKAGGSFTGPLGGMMPRKDTFLYPEEVTASLNQPVPAS